MQWEILVGTSITNLFCYLSLFKDEQLDFKKMKGKKQFIDKHTAITYMNLIFINIVNFIYNILDNINQPHHHLVSIHLRH